MAQKNYANNEARMRDLEDTVEQLRGQIEYLVACTKGAPKLPFIQRFPDVNTIVKLQVQLFVSPPIQGRSERVLKAYVWDNTKSRAMIDIWKDGYYIPFNSHALGEPTPSPEQPLTDR